MPISRISSGSLLTREMRLMSIMVRSATLFNIFIFFVLISSAFLRIYFP